MGESVEYDDGSMYLDPADAGRFISMEEQIASAVHDRDRVTNQLAAVERELDELVSEMQMHLGILHQLESDPQAWVKYTKGTGIATLNGYRQTLSRIQFSKPKGEWITINDDGSNLPEHVEGAEWRVSFEEGEDEWMIRYHMDSRFLARKHGWNAICPTAYYSIPHIDRRPDIPPHEPKGGDVDVGSR